MPRPKKDNAKDKRYTVRVGPNLDRGLLMAANNDNTPISETIRTLLVEALKARKVAGRLK